MPFSFFSGGGVGLKVRISLWKEHETEFMEKSQELASSLLWFLASRIVMMEKVSPEYEMKQLDKCRRAKTRSYAILSHCPLPLWAGDNNNKVASPAAVGQQLGSSGFCWHFCFGPGSWSLAIRMWKPQRNAQLASNLN